MKNIISLIVFIFTFQLYAKTIIDSIEPRFYYDVERPLLSIKILNDSPSKIKFPLYFTVNSCEVKYQSVMWSNSKGENDPCLNNYAKTYAFGKDLLPNDKIEFKSDTCCVEYINCEVVGKIKESNFSHKFQISSFGKSFGCIKVAEFHLR